jgi:hypothetical protein
MQTKGSEISFSSSDLVAIYTFAAFLIEINMQV